MVKDIFTLAVRLEIGWQGRNQLAVAAGNGDWQGIPAAARPD